MEIKTLETRIENTKKNLEKLNAKVARINVALAGGPNPYYYHESDLRSTNREIAQLEENLKKYQIQLEKEINRENAPKIEVLVKFLVQWKERAVNYYHQEAVALYEMKEECSREEKKCSNNRDAMNVWRDYQKRISNRFSYVTRDLATYKEPYIDEERLDKILNDEVKRKYEDLVARVTKVVGEIKDCGYLEIGNNGSINGRVIGDKAQAYVETIYAGGYNIQCLHYRVLVKPIKK